MENFRAVSPQEIQGNVFQKIEKEWMLVGAKNQDAANLMTASWGGLGILWRKPVAFVFVRPQRFTRELLDKQSCFSLSFYPEEFRPQLNLCGSVSGRDTDKLRECGFQLLWEGDAPYTAQCSLALICKKLYAQPLDPACFAEPSIDPLHYPNKDYHRMYVAEITGALLRRE